MRKELSDAEIQKLAREIHEAAVKGETLYAILSYREQDRYNAYCKNAFYEPIPAAKPGKGKKLRVAILTKNVKNGRR